MTSTFDTNTRTRTIAASKATSPPGAVGSRAAIPPGAPATSAPASTGNRAPARGGIAAKRVSTAFPQRLIILALAVGAILLGLSAPVVHAGPDDGPGSEPGPPYVPSGQTPPLALPPIQASQNPVVFYGVETKKNIEVTWTPFKWAPVHVQWKAVGGPKLGGHSQTVDPSEDPHFIMEVTYGRTYQAYLATPSVENDLFGPLVGPTLTITTVRVELASTDPPPRVTSIPGVNPHPDPPGTQRLNPGAPARNTIEERTSG